MQDWPFFLIGCLAASIGSVLLYQVFARTIISYHIGTHGLEVKVFGLIRVIRLPFRRVKSIELIGFRTALIQDFTTLRFGNRIWGQLVRVKTRAGLYRAIIITPDNAEKFVLDFRAAWLAAGEERPTS